MDGHRPLSAIWQRLRGDFQLAIITLFGASTTLTLLPFACWRLARGDLALGLVDAAIIALLGGATVRAWRCNDLLWPAAVMGVSANVGCLVMVYLQPLGLFWVYPTLVATYFLMPRRWAVILSLLSLVVVMAFEHVFASLPQQVTFLASGALVTLFSFIFAARTQAQHRKLRRLANQDPLTGAHNRRAMEEELDRVVAAYQRDPQPVSLAIIDIDHFKHINDTAGHEAGDRVLQAFAALVRRNARGYDGLFRYGGEEFVLLLPGADTALLSSLGDRLRADIAAGLRHEGRPVTVSIGAAELRAGEHWQGWLARADAAMYQAKQGGRDRMVLASS